MKLIAGCGETSPCCPRIFQNEDARYVVVGTRLKLEEQIGLDLQADERAVYIPQDVMLEAARQIMLQLAQD